jgi:hypothetical protein
MLSQSEISLMLVGAALIVAAIASGWLPGNTVGSTVGRVCRALAGVAGAALIAWGLVSHVGPGGLLHGARAAPVHRGPSAAELVRDASAAVAACPAATAPTVPDGATASFQEMQAADAAFRAYDAATNSYSRCVDAAVAKVAKQFAGVAEAPDLAALNLFGTRAHNVAIDQEEAVVSQFNDQLHIYKARHHRS